MPSKSIEWKAKGSRRKPVSTTVAAHPRVKYDRLSMRPQYFFWINFGHRMRFGIQLGAHLPRKYLMGKEYVGRGSGLGDGYAVSGLLIFRMQKNFIAAHFVLTAIANKFFLCYRSVHIHQRFVVFG